MFGGFIFGGAYYRNFTVSSFSFPVQVSNHSTPTARRSISSPRTAPVRSIHTANPFQFISPVKGPSRVSLSRSLSFESLRNKDPTRTQGNKLSDVQSILKHERLSKISPGSVGDLNRSLPIGLEPGSITISQPIFPAKVPRSLDENNVLQFCGSVEEAQNSNGSLAREGFTATGAEKNLTVTIPPRKGSEGLSSSALVLHESHFWEPEQKRTPSPALSPGTPLGMSYPGTCSIPGSKPVVIRKYGSTPSREEQSSVDLMEYDLINESDFSSLRSSAPHPSSNDDYLVVEGFPGIQSSTV